MLADVTMIIYVCGTQPTGNMKTSC